MTAYSPNPKPAAGPDDPTRLWQSWRDDPQNEAFDATLKSLQPVINMALAGHGAGGDPVMRAHARGIAGDAIRTYSPDSGAGLPTWTTQQMQRLKRLKRNTGNVVRLPERVMLDHMELQRVSKEFLDQNDREPTVEELAERSNISRKRVSDVIRMSRKTPTEAAVGENNLLLGNTDPELTEATDMVYEDSDTTDRKLLEWRAGYGGVEIIPSHVAAKNLGLSPFAVSRRAQRLALKIQKAHRDLQKASGSYRSD